MTSPTHHSEPLSQASDPAQRDARAHGAEGPLAAAALPGSRIELFDAKMKLLPGVTIPLRSMLVSAREQQILISPVGTADEASQIDGTSLTLVAPSLLHHLHVGEAIERYRPVALWGPPGLSAKVPELGPMQVLGTDPWPHRDELDFVLVDGAPKRNEVVFLHRASRTIYTADLFFNIAEPEGFLSPLAFRMLGIHRRFAMAKMWRHWVTDRAAFARSIDAILAWDFDRIVMAHGDVVERDARARFLAAVRELELIG
jgi:hypothetical protein